MTTTERHPSSGRPPLQLIGLAAVYAVTAALAVWQASRHLTPTIFSDELEMTQMSRSIAETGEGTLRGQPTGLPPLAAYLTRADLVDRRRADRVHRRQDARQRC